MKYSLLLASLFLCSFAAAATLEDRVEKLEAALLLRWSCSAKCTIYTPWFGFEGNKYQSDDTINMSGQDASDVINAMKKECSDRRIKEGAEYWFLSQIGNRRLEPSVKESCAH